MLNADLQCTHHVMCLLQTTVHLCFFLSVAARVELGVLWKSYSLPICSSTIATKIRLSCVKHFTCFQCFQDFSQFF